MCPDCHDWVCMQESLAANDDTGNTSITLEVCQLRDVPLGVRITSLYVCHEIVHTTPHLPLPFAVIEAKTERFYQYAVVFRPWD